MTIIIIFVLATAAIPFVFLILDSSIRSILEMPLDDLGPDVMLIGVSLCLARMVEVVDTLVNSSQPIEHVENYGAQFMLFVLLFLISLLVWFWCLGILRRRVGEKWKYIGGEDMPVILSAMLGISTSLTMTLFYAVSRIII